ncbi:MAG: hypothetical protein U9N51_12385 [Bacteroidota bacterium]|nr:hypothetical protein [Bacteroidota bacterium]
MKKGILSLVVFFIATVLFAQVDSYTVAASKTYENRTKTVYLDLSAVLDAETAKMIEQGMVAQSDIHKFSFYAAPNYEKCMFTSALNVHEDEILALMNEFIYEVNPATMFQTEFTNHGNQGDYYKVVFVLDRLPDDDVIKAIHLSLKESDFITDVNYRDKARFEIYAFEPMYPEQVNQLLEQYNVKISQTSITQK